MSLKPLIALAVAGATILPAAAAAAASGEPMSRPAEAADRRFDELDRNRDGFVSRAEANDARELDARFSELDADNDGKLSRSEYRVVAAGEAGMLPGAPSAASGATRR